MRTAYVDNPQATAAISAKVSSVDCRGFATTDCMQGATTQILDTDQTLDLVPDAIVIEQGKWLSSHGVHEQTACQKASVERQIASHPHGHHLGRSV